MNAMSPVQSDSSAATPCKSFSISRKRKLLPGAFAVIFFACFQSSLSFWYAAC